MMNTQVEVYVPAFNAPIPFVSGDALGTEKRELALLDATIQGSLQEKGSVRDKLYALQGALTNLPEVDCPLQHMFAPGVYIRTIFIPKGTCIVGKIHKHRHANILSSGSVLVLTESGGLEKINWSCSNGLRTRNKASSICSCLLYTSPSPRDRQKSRMPSSA